MQENDIKDLKALLREAADWLNSDSHHHSEVLAKRLEAAAESLGEPAAWLVQHPKYMPEPCVEIASYDYHAPDIMEGEKAKGWVFTPLYAVRGEV